MMLLYTLLYSNYCSTTNTDQSNQRRQVSHAILNIEEWYRDWSKQAEKPIKLESKACGLSQRLALAWS